MKTTQFHIVFFSLVLLLGSMRFSVVTSWYQYNQMTIEKYLCENIDKPELQCNGKCFLNKNLAQQSENEKPENLGVLYNIDHFFTQIIVDINGQQQVDIIQHLLTPDQSFFLDKSKRERIFKPPIS